MTSETQDGAHGATHISKLTVAGLLVTLGIVYGDIGTSPLYVFRAIITGVTNITPDFIYGAISCIIWTLTLQTTVKYVIITLKADNKGEGGIFSLFALIRRRARWAYIFAIIGGSTLLADGIITPCITVVSAIEGLQAIKPSLYVLPIALVILAVLFLVQQFGTKLLGRSFGPIMFFWFGMLGFFGFINLIDHPQVLLSFNPYYAYKLLMQYPNGFALLGAVFLCTTGAEALYSDLGHCGIKNIRVSWMYVKTTLILNYLGVGAWILSHTEQCYATPGINPFFAVMPDWFVVTGVIIATMAAIIASQALISGSYTLISEAISLNFWPKIEIKYPTFVKGQMYIPSINMFLFISCVLVVLFFQESSKMEAAYGLSITITMLMTTLLLTLYLYQRNVHSIFLVVLFITYISIEGAFLAANLVKFIHGGWITIMIAGVFLVIMYIFYNGRRIKNRFFEYDNFDKIEPILLDIIKDESIPKYATNLVYLTNSFHPRQIESKIMYSILNKQPKRADVYWFIHVDVVDEPYCTEYKVHHIVEGTIIRVDFRIGFRVNPRINFFFRQVLEDMVENKEIDLLSRYESLRKHELPGDFRFVIIDRIQNYDFDFDPIEQFIMDMYEVLKRIGIPDVKSYGLDTSNVSIEKVPLLLSNNPGPQMIRKD